MQKILICDDNPQIVQYIAQQIDLLWKLPHQNILFENWFSLETYLAQEDADILLIDICLGEENGINLTKRLQKQNTHLKVIFITGYVEYAQDIFSCQPIGFLLKPVQPEKLLAALESATHAIAAEQKSYLVIQHKSTLTRIRFRDIMYAESVGRILYIHEAEQCTEYYEKLNNLETQLPPSFVRCHQSYIVNMEYVRSMTNKCFFLLNGVMISISKAYSKAVKDTYYHYLGQNFSL